MTVLGIDIVPFWTHKVLAVVLILCQWLRQAAVVDKNFLAMNWTSVLIRFWYIFKINLFDDNLISVTDQVCVQIFVSKARSLTIECFTGLAGTGYVIEMKCVLQKQEQLTFIAIVNTWNLQTIKVAFLLKSISLLFCKYSIAVEHERWPC
jgi:hypothetical protein